MDEEQKSAFKTAYSDSTYQYANFKQDVLSVLETRFGDDAVPGEKAVNIQSNGSRRSVDVLVAAQFRRYRTFFTLIDQIYDEGICFYDTSGKRTENYPKQHSMNCTAKHQATNSRFKPMVRILKNLRGSLVDEGAIATGIAPSYYIEGLLYNVPDDKFRGSYVDTFVNCINWLNEADRSKFVCANEQHYLLREDSPTSWAPKNCDEFLAAAINLWKLW